MSSKTTTKTDIRHDRPAAARHRHIALPAVLVVVFAMSAVLLLAAAAAMLLAEWLGSQLLAAAVLGGFLLLLAAAVYFIWLHPAVRSISERFEAVCEVAEKTGELFDRVREKIRMLRRLLAIIRQRW